VFANEASIMRYDDHCSIRALFEEFNVALLVKTSVPNSDNFVDEETIKFHNHRYSECQPRPHALRIRPHRLFEVKTKFGEFFNKINVVMIFNTVDAAYELKIIYAS